MSDLESKRKERSVARRLFTRCANELESILQNKTKATRIEAKVIYSKLNNLRKDTVRLDKLLKELLLVNVAEEELEKEVEEAWKYETKWLLLDATYNENFSDTTNGNGNNKQRNLKLPKLQLHIFDGEVKNWLAFWGQFTKIHDDLSLDNLDKYQYLLQSMKDNSEVKKLVESFPPMAYSDCIEQLKARYAREDLLIQIYVREILSLVLMKEDAMTATQLYDKLNAQLRALDTLGVTKDKYAAFLLPMVESALNQDLLRTWERTKGQCNDVAEELANLLDFLRKEVDSEQRIELTRKTFNNNNSKEEESSQKERPQTAECLLTGTKIQNMKTTCVWCDKDTHSSAECYKIHKMNVDQRKQFLKEKKACGICLRRGHHPKICKASVKCLICHKRHSTVLCPEQKMEEKPSSKENTETSTLSSVYPKGETLLQTIVVEVEIEGRKMPVRALLDSGSQRTYIKQDITEKLKIPTVGKEKLTHYLFGGVEINSKDCNLYNFTIRGLNDSSNFKLDVTAIGQNSICGNIPKFNPKDVQLSNLLQEHNITLTDRGNKTEIGLLIGADFLGFLLTGTLIKMKNGLVAVKTCLGWTLQGKQVSINADNNHTTMLHCTCIDNNLTEYWSLETLGIRDPSQVKSKAEATADIMTTFTENIKTQDSRYEVKLPFKTNFTDLLPNYERSKQRLISMTKKLISTNKFQQYDSLLKDWLELGIIEKADSNTDSSHFLPHRPIIKEQSLTSSMRPVFDASAAEKNGLSLNTCLEKGCNLIDLIPNLINNFRTGAIGITADIEKAFLQISLTQSDRDYLKFLWYQDELLNNIITYRHCRVVFGLTSSPFLLSATLQYHLNKMKDGPLGATAEILNRSFYVDNCLVSMDTESEANKFIEESKNIMQEAKFNLRMWVTSQGINETGKDTISILGLNWDTISDELYCNSTNLPPCDNLQNITKRGLLSLTQKVFDPIGYTAPVMLTPKLILQETWRRQLSWDDELPADLLYKFQDWYKYITYLKDCRVPRRLTADILKESKVSLHMFCDASKDGCGACVLLRAEKAKKVSVQLIAAKSRVTPPQKVTIPRLELTAALIGSRLLTSVRESLSFHDYPEYCWTDSGVVLCWIKRELPLNTFVGNRVKEIRQNTNIKNWYHVPGELNWADLASRGCNAKVLLNCRWWEGPTWLRLTPEEWPRSELVVNENEVNLETKKSVCHTISTETSLLHTLQKYFSKYTKIIRMTAWMWRFINNTRYVNNKKKGELTYKEYEKAEKTIIKLIQKDNSESLKEKTRNLTKFHDKEGIIRIKTKLLLSDFPENVRTPYLLPAKDQAVILMVRQRHAQLQHAGTNQLITDIRSRFWIIGIRHLVRSVISGCTICTRYRSKPTQAPTAPLPPERVTCSAPFQTTGVDLAGPLYLCEGEKCWIVLYTCAVYRAVHLELTRSLSTEAFIMTLRRFTARRGRVTGLMSDQGTNFHGTKNLLNTLNWDEIQRQATIRRITWKMNAPSAAWWGGYWERLIRIMKDLLKRILGKTSVSYDELETLLCDCEATMNGRPLTYINSDKGECLEPLTPTYFIQPIPDSDVTDFDKIDSNNMNSRLQYLQSLREQFRQRFKSEYLTFLVQKGKEKKDNIGKGDIVLIETDEKRIKWPLGIIEEMLIGTDGVQRTARVKTATGVRIRPVQRLYKLEITGNNFHLIKTTHTPQIPEIKEAGPPAPSVTPDSSSVTSDLHDKHPQSTRSGRQVRLPGKFDLYV